MTTPTQSFIDLLLSSLPEHSRPFRPEARGELVEAMDKFGAELVRQAVEPGYEPCVGARMAKAQRENAEAWREMLARQDHAPPSEGSAGASDDGEVTQLSGGEAPVCNGCGHLVPPGHARFHDCEKPVTPKRRFTAPEQLPVGAKVRIVEIGEDKEPGHKVGDILRAEAIGYQGDQAGGYIRESYNPQGYIAIGAAGQEDTWVRTVELVEEQPVSEPEVCKCDSMYLRRSLHSVDCPEAGVRDYRSALGFAERMRDDAQTRVASLESELSAERAVTAELREKIERLQKVMVEQRDSIAATSRSYSVLSTQATELRVQLQAAKVGHEVYVGSAEECVRQRDAFEDQLTQARESLAVEQSAHQVTQAKLVDAKKQRDEARGHVGKVEDQWSDVVRKLDVAESARFEAEHQHNDACERIAHLQSQLAESHRQREAMASGIDTVKRAWVSIGVTRRAMVRDDHPRLFSAIVALDAIGEPRT
jgi:hypothetical protein